LYKVFARLYWPRPSIDKQGERERIQLERKYVMEMSLLAEAVVRVGKVDEFTILEFAEMAGEFGERCSRQNNVILNRGMVHRLLDMGQRDGMKRKLSDKCRVVKSALKSK
jgi:hypothetical protein